MYAYRYIITFYISYVVYNVVGEHDGTENRFSDLIRRSLVATAHSCMDHVNATVHDLEKLRDDPPYPETSACIIKCLLEKGSYKLTIIVTNKSKINMRNFYPRCRQIGVVKSNKYSKIGFMTAVTPLVFTNKNKLEHMKAVSENCDREVNHKHETPCQLGNEITTCIFKYAPELHLKA